MSLAAETRRAASAQPFLVTALRAGVVNYTAAARFLDVDGDPEAIAAALRRYAEDLPQFERTRRDVRVTMQSGLTVFENRKAHRVEAEPLLAVGGVAVCDAGAGGKHSAILASGAVDTGALSVVLYSLVLEDIAVRAAGVGDNRLIVVVDRLDGANAVRVVERALANVPNEPTA